MRLKTKLVLAFTGASMVLAVGLLSVFFVQLLRVRLEEAASANRVLGQSLLSSVRQALANDLTAHPPTGPTSADLDAAVIAALQTDAALRADMDAIVRYAPIVQDVFISGANGQVLASTDPVQEDKAPPVRDSLDAMVHGSLRGRLALVFGRPQVLNVGLELRRNGRPFLFLHMGVRSTFLRNALQPWMREALWIGLIALGCSVAGAFLLSSLALRPLEKINRHLEELGAEPNDAPTPVAAERDAEQQAASNLARIDERMRRSAARTSDLETNLSQMLHTLKDGILLLSSEGMIVLASDAVQQYLPANSSASPGHHITQAFPESTTLGSTLVQALAARTPLHRTPATLDDGSPVEITLAFPPSAVAGGRGVGAMLTLHNAAAEQALEQELEVGRRLASIGRLTAGVGHEVKNPINAMVLHLELLRGKLQAGRNGGPPNDAGRHVEVLASEMARLDRVVQTLADFTRPLEPELRDQAVRPIVDAVLQLVSVDATARGVRIVVQDDAPGAIATLDAELLHQALLNIVLNAMEAMPNGGDLGVTLQRSASTIRIAVRDSGHGIPPELLDRIFHLYFTTKSTGTGIGLAMTWRIVQMMGGSIRVQSHTVQQRGEPGTLFLVEFPLTAGKRPSAPAQGAFA